MVQFLPQIGGTFIHHIFKHKDIFMLATRFSYESIRRSIMMLRYDTT